MRRFLLLLEYARPLRSASKPASYNHSKPKPSEAILKRDSVARKLLPDQSLAQRFRRSTSNEKSRTLTPYFTFVKWFVITGIWTAAGYHYTGNKLSVHRIKGNSMAPTLRDESVEAGTKRDWVWFHPIPPYQAVDTTERKWLRTYGWTVGPDGVPSPLRRPVNTTTEPVRREEDVQGNDETDEPDILYENIPYVRRGSIVLFRSPTVGGWAVKRVIGLPGDRIRPLPRPKGRDDLGETIKRRPYVNDRSQGFSADSPLFSGKSDDSETGKTEDNANRASPSDPSQPDSDGYITVPYHHVWVEGDNQEKSLDSNDWGVLSKTMIHAKADRILLPIDPFHRLKHWAEVSFNGPRVCPRRRRDWEDDGWEGRVGDRLIKRPDDETAAEMVPAQWELHGKSRAS
ncbi:MAG: hypothetical protein M1831_000336 [Alyxoria varia]|nr:MAG: hypothetical protein M1831_000336 [Alyxoria varia]